MESKISEPERLSADDENARDRILSIDLSVYDDLVTYPAGIDWPNDRRKLLFLQTALSLKIPWADVVRYTSPYFGQTLRTPGGPVVVVPIIPPPFMPPVFDIARQTVGQWTTAANEAWNTYCAYAATVFEEHRRREIRSGILREFERARQNTGIDRQKKGAILGEKAVYLYGVLYFFAVQFGRPLTWAELADQELDLGKFKGTAPQRAKAKRKAAEQIRTNVTVVLRTLKLPVSLPE